MSSMRILRPSCSSKSSLRHVMLQPVNLNNIHARKPCKSSLNLEVDVMQFLDFITASGAAKWVIEKPWTLLDSFQPYQLHVLFFSWKHTSVGKFAITL